MHLKIMFWNVVENNCQIYFFLFHFSLQKVIYIFTTPQCSDFMSCSFFIFWNSRKRQKKLWLTLNYFSFYFSIAIKYCFDCIIARALSSHACILKCTWISRNNKNVLFLNKIATVWRCLSHFFDTFWCVFWQIQGDLSFGYNAFISKKLLF